jgi:hypothetical protein
MRKEFRLSAISSEAKKAALGAMLASSVAMFASNPIKTARTENPQQTEVISKDGAEALKALTFPQEKQTPAVPTVHNQKLDEKFLKLADNDEEKKFMEDFLSNIYNSNGSYLASATIQQNIDLNMFLAFLDGNIEILKRFDEEAYNKIDRDAMQKVAEKSGPIKEWLNENYFAVYNQPFGQFDNPPDAEEVSNALDKYLNEDPYNLFGGETSIDRNYTLLNNICKRRLANTNYDNIQKGSNYVAYQVVNADYLLFFSLLKSFGIDIVSHIDNPHDKNLVKYLSVVSPNTGL